MRSKRNRIVVEATVGEKVLDAEAFVQNRCSDYTKWILTSLEHISIEIYFDKHYFVRLQYGDADGKRIGIDFEDVKKLVIEASRHLFLHASKVRTFSFVNFEAVDRRNRIVLTKMFEDELKLNIVVEYHFLDMNRYEVTLITAIRNEDFYFSDGSFQLGIQVDGSSSVYRNEKGKVKLISEFIQ